MATDVTWLTVPNTVPATARCPAIVVAIVVKWSFFSEAKNGPRQEYYRLRVGGQRLTTVNSIPGSVVGV